MSKNQLKMNMMTMPIAILKVNHQMILRSRTPSYEVGGQEGGEQYDETEEHY